MPGVRGLGPVDPVELGRVAARLVDLHVQLRRVEDDRPPAGRALGRRQERDRLLGVLLGVAEQVERADVLVAGRLPAAAVVRPAPALVLVALDRVGLHARADVGDRLLGEAAVARRERLPLALGGVQRLRVGDALDPVHRRVGGQQVRDLRFERDRERVLDDRGLERAVGGRPVVEHDRAAEGGGRGPGDADGLRGDPVDLGRLDAPRAGEAPRAVDEDPDAEALALARGDALDPAGLDRDRLGEAMDDADVGVGGAAARGGVQGPSRSGRASPVRVAVHGREWASGGRPIRAAVADLAWIVSRARGGGVVRGPGCPRSPGR